METVGDVLKTEGIEKVLENAPDDWQKRVVQSAHKLLHRTQFVTGESIRLYALLHGSGNPHHPNAWGAVMRSLSKSGDIERTDRITKAVDPKQHSTMLPVWKSNLYRPAANEAQIAAAA